MQILTTSGYKDAADCVVGEQLVAFDISTGAPIVNTLEAIALVTAGRPESPVSNYTINGIATFCGHQSIWADDNVTHVFRLQIGQTIYDENDNPIVVSSIVEAAPSQWYRLEVSGDHSYIADGITLHNASRFWVGGTGTWDGTSTAHWSASSGGGSGASAPTSSDDAFLNGSSGTGTVTYAATNVCASLDCTGYTGTLTSGTADLACHGSILISSGMTFTPGGFVSLTDAGSGPYTITSNGKDFTNGLNIAGAGSTYTLQDNITCSAYGLQISKAVLDLNGKTLSVKFVNWSDTRLGSTLTFGAGSIVVTGNDTDSNPVFYLDTRGPLTVNAGTGTVKFTDTSSNSCGFSGSGLSWPTVYFNRGSSTGMNYIYEGGNTIATLTDDGSAAHTFQFVNGTTTTIGTSFNINGTSGNNISLRSDISPTQFTLSKASGTVNANFLDIQDSIATGGATWNALSSVDSGHNSGWIFINVNLVTTGFYGLEVVQARKLIVVGY